MADLINSSYPLEASSRVDSAGKLFGDSVAPDISEPASRAAAAAASQEADNSARFREEMRRRCEAPLLLPSGHDGLNE
jgi:hypothetical protein